MTPQASLELPADKEGTYQKAVRLEWLTIAYLVSAIFFLFITLGNSQAMKAAWIEDILSLASPAAFLIAGRLRRRKHTDRFPWGYHRAVSIAYMAAALAILLLGSFVFFDSAAKLVTLEHPPIGLVEVFGVELWLGWPMLAALAWSAGPAFLLGRAKLPLAQALHDKVLYADSKMNKADWLTASAAMVGVVGIGFGLWWADAVAAIAISLDIIHDGYTNLRAAVTDLMDSRPTRHDSDEEHPLVDRLEKELLKRDWIEAAKVRLREEGHVFAGEAHVVPASNEDLVDHIERTHDELISLDWRLHDLVIAPVGGLDDQEPPGKADHQGA